MLSAFHRRILRESFQRSDDFGGGGGGVDTIHFVASQAILSLVQI